MGTRITLGIVLGAGDRAASPLLAVETVAGGDDDRPGPVTRRPAQSALLNCLEPDAAHITWSSRPPPGGRRKVATRRLLASVSSGVTAL